MLNGELIAMLLPIIENEELRIEHFSPIITSETDGIVLVTGQLSIRGRFVGIVKLLDRLDGQFSQCKIISAQYRTVTPRDRNGVKTLNCTIYIQQITTNSTDD